MKNYAFGNATKNENETKEEKKQLIKIKIEPFYTRKSETDKTIIFESRFESGNLAAVVKASERDYHLLL